MSGAHRRITDVTPPERPVTIGSTGALYRGHPGFKRDGTSKEAAISIAPVAATLRTQVMMALKERGPMTADECATHLRRSILSVRPRLSELEREGAIEATGTRRMNYSGKSAMVWRAKDASHT